MMRRFGVALVVGAVLLAGCAVPLVPMAHKPCKHGDPLSCTITVTANEKDGACTATVDAEHVDVEKDNKDATLTWTLHPDSRNAGYRFANYGVVFLNAGINKQWKLDDQHSDDAQIQWTDRNDDGVTYTYVVLLVKSVGDEYMKCPSIDPWIHNQ